MVTALPYTDNDLRGTVKRLPAEELASLRETAYVLRSKCGVAGGRPSHDTRPSRQAEPV